MIVMAVAVFCFQFVSIFSPADGKFSKAHLALPLQSTFCIPLFKRPSIAMQQQPASPAPACNVAHHPPHTGTCAKLFIYYLSPIGSVTRASAKLLNIISCRHAHGRRREGGRTGAGCSQLQRIYTEKRFYCVYFVICFDFSCCGLHVV